MTGKKVRATFAICQSPEHNSQFVLGNEPTGGYFVNLAPVPAGQAADFLEEHVGRHPDRQDKALLLTVEKEVDHRDGLPLGYTRVYTEPDLSVFQQPVQAFFEGPKDHQYVAPTAHHRKTP